MALSKYDRKSIAQTNAIYKSIEKAFRAAIRDAVALSEMIDPESIKDAMLSFDNFPNVRARANAIFDNLGRTMQVSIVNGVRSQWTLANNKNDELCRQVFGDALGNISKGMERRYFNNNADALQAHINRMSKGMTFSDRVWNYAQDYRKEIEMALHYGISSGHSADEISRMLRQSLVNPDALFRRVRNADGDLVLSKAAKAYHPGQGVYRSAYMNARRLASTECNIAYRTSDHLRWQQMDFVVGVEISTSTTNHSCKGVKGVYVDICDELQGKYPKDFKWTGWHPHCRCHAVPVFKTEEEILADSERIMRGQEPTPGSVNSVTDLPDNFKDWVVNNEERIASHKSQPYFLADNKALVAAIDRTPKGETKFGDVLTMLGSTNIERVPVARHAVQPTEQQIIDAVGGGDMTEGSCSSLAFTYAAQKGGLNVLDFRDGLSRKFFAHTSHIVKIANALGIDVPFYGTGIELCKQMEIGKEYYLAIARHAAICRRVGKAQYEYLELQSATNNGWKKLDSKVFGWRFSARGREFHPTLIDIDLLNNDARFADLMAYINTASANQRKSMKGTIK